MNFELTGSWMEDGETAVGIMIPLQHGTFRRPTWKQNRAWQVSLVLGLVWWNVQFSIFF